MCRLFFLRHAVHLFISLSLFHRHKDKVRPSRLTNKRKKEKGEYHCIL